MEVVFAKEPERGGTPEDELLRQFQGMIAEYERAQIAERTRRGKLHRARGGSQAVMSGAPYGYRYVKKSEHMEGFWEIDEAQAQVVRDVFDRYVDRWRLDRRARALADRAGRADQDRQDALGPLDDLGDAAQPRLSRAGRVREDEDRRAPRRPDARPPASAASATAAGSPATTSRPRSGR